MSTATLHIEIEKILIPKLRFQGFEGEWEKKKLGDVGKIRMCKRVFSDETSESGEIPFYKIGTFGKEADAYITNELYFNYRERFSFPKIGEILMSASGTLGRTVVYDGKPAYFQDSNIVWIDNNEKLITNSFLYYIYQIVKYDSEGGTIQRLYNSIISNTKFNRPTLPEQQKIASFLSAVDEKIQQLSRKKELLSQYKKGVMQQLFSGKLRFKDENGKDYADWKIIKVQELINKKAIISLLDGNHGALYPKSEEFAEKGVPYVAANNLVNGQVKFSECKYLPVERAKKFKKGIAKSGDVLFAHNATVGPTALLKTELDYIILSTTVTYYRCDLNILSNTYLLHYFNSDNFISQYSKVMSQSTRNQVPITMQKKFNIDFPCLEEQKKIANFLSSIDAKIENTNAALEKTQGFKKGLLQQMFV